LYNLRIKHSPDKEQHTHPSAKIKFTETRTYREVDRDSCEFVTTVTDVKWSVSFRGTRITRIGNEDVDDDMEEFVM
jgi:hypothetical protein